MSQKASSIFRKEALERHREVDAPLGDILRGNPGWVGASYWLLVGVCVSGLIFATFGSIYQYAAGPALVLAADKTQVTARASGLVDRVETSPGARVEKGAPLVQLRSEREAAELERIEQETEQQLARSLLDRSDHSAREALVSLRAQKELAFALLAERVVRAPRAGVVSDIRIRPGQHLETGDLVLTMMDATPRFHLVAMLPGNMRPELHSGMPLRLELAGYRYSHQALSIERVGEQVVGATETRRFLGPEFADTVPLGASMVLVHASLEATAFNDEGRSLSFYDGMQGTAEVRVRRTPIIVVIFPWLKALF